MNKQDLINNSYRHIDMMAQMRDKMRNDFLKFDVESDKENICQ